jgi:hypothetical protein
VTRQPTDRHLDAERVTDGPARVTAARGEADPEQLAGIQATVPRGGTFGALLARTDGVIGSPPPAHEVTMTAVRGVIHSGEHSVRLSLDLLVAPAALSLVDERT